MFLFISFLHPFTKGSHRGHSNSLGPVCKLRMIKEREISYFVRNFVRNTFSRQFNELAT